MIGRNIIFIFAVARINEKEKPAIIILHPGKKIRLPFCLLQQIAFSVTTFGQAKIIQRATPGKASTAKTRK